MQKGWKVKEKEKEKERKREEEEKRGKEDLALARTRFLLMRGLRPIGETTSRDLVFRPYRGFAKFLANQQERHAWARTLPFGFPCVANDDAHEQSI